MKLTIETKYEVSRELAIKIIAIYLQQMAGTLPTSKGTLLRIIRDMVTAHSIPLLESTGTEEESGALSTTSGSRIVASLMMDRYLVKEFPKDEKTK